MSQLRKHYFLLIAIVLAVFSVDGILSSLQAQYFGRNKVQYENFDFKIIHSEHFDVYHYPEENEVANDATFMLERWYQRYMELFEVGISMRQPVIIYANHPDFQQTNVISGRISQGTGGVTEGMRNRVVLPMTGVYAEYNHVLGHELVHAYQYDILRTRGGGLRAANRLPLWMVEGMAEYLSIGRHDPLTSMWMRDAVLQEDVPTIRQVSRNQRYFPYRYGHAIWSYIAGRWSDITVASLFNASMRGNVSEGMESVLGLSMDSLSGEWQQAIRQHYGAQIEGKTRPSEVGEPIITDQGETNMAPTISPDGEYITFLSRRELFTLDLYLADAETGEVIKKLSTSDTDAHFDALQFMNASGAWSPDSRTFAYVVIEDGDNSIVLLDVETAEVTSTIEPEPVDAIKHLAWSPDGNAIVFSGTSGGINNLYKLNVTSGDVTQLTHDRYAEIQPSWSPDGEMLAFATDRGSQTSFDDYQFGSMNIGLMSAEGGDIDILAIDEGVKHIDPEFSSEGDDLFFISDPDGFSDLYRYDFEDDTFYRVTNIATGISGLTENSPTMSVAVETGRVVFSVFQNHDYNIYGLSSEETNGTPYTSQQGAYAANTALPPVAYSSDGSVQSYLSTPTRGLPTNPDFTQNDYTPTLQLLRVGQTGVGLVVDRFGASLGGGINFLFGDMLGNQLLSASVQANGGFKDIGSQVMYRNRDNRFNWGLGAGHIPYRTSGSSTQTGLIPVDGDTIPGTVYTRLIRRTFIDRVSAMTEYPFSRNRRLEFSAGYTHISYNAEAQITEATLDGRIIDERTEDLPTPTPLDLFQPSVAYVGDYSYSGFTSPIDGKRFRFEVEPTLGSIQYVSALADYRQYNFWRPVTFAFRFMHYGRYLGDAESDRLTTLQLGYETYVRGYSPSTFNNSECTGPNCIQFNRLTGSRIGIFNAELRLPIFGTEQFGILNFPYLPTELVGFVDGGVAWTSNDPPTWEWARRSDERIPVFSTGVGARINLFGYLIAQVYYAYPFQRPDKGAHFGFVISPGW